MTLTQYEPMDMAITPSEVVAGATEQAKVLMDVVNSRRLFTEIDGKKYLEAEAWEIILAFNKAHPVPEWVKPVTEEGEIVGYIARVNIMQGGEIVSAGEMPCGFDDFPCRGKEGTAKHKAAMSAAQTWALSKAARMKFAWVAVLGGYAPTPADEIKAGVNTPAAPKDNRHMYPTHHVEWFKKGKMKHYAHPIGNAPDVFGGAPVYTPEELDAPIDPQTGEVIILPVAPAAPKDNRHMCPTHHVEWFKKGKMKHYAHPIGDTGKWCNMADFKLDTDAKPNDDDLSSPEHAQEATQDAQEAPSKQTLEDMLAGLPQVKTIGELRTLGTKHLGYRNVAEMEAVTGPHLAFASQEDLALAVAQLVQFSPLKPKEVQP